MTTPAGIYPILYVYFDAQGRPDRDAMRRAIRAGAHGIMTDRPDLLLDELMTIAPYT